MPEVDWDCYQSVGTNGMILAGSRATVRTDEVEWEGEDPGYGWGGGGGSCFFNRVQTTRAAYSLYFVLKNTDPD